jgi:transcription antitermination protein NusB
MPLTRYEQRLRRRARARAVQALYAWDVVGGHTLLAMAQRVWDDLGVSAEEREIAAPLVRTVSSRQASLDSDIAELASNWRLERMGAVERAVLRLAAAELVRGETPPRVAIQEAVHLAERFGSPESARFVNGVLDAFARRTGSL